MSAMRVIITDEQALRALSWKAVKAYLEASGWHRDRAVADKGVIYQHTDKGGRLREIAVLTRDDLADYAARMADAVGTLSRAEDRSELDIYEDLRALGAETSRHGNGLTAESLDLIAQALQMLPSQQRRIFLLRVVHGLSLEAIARIEGVTTTTVKAQASRARRRLSEYLVSQKDFPGAQVLADERELNWEDAARHLRLS